MSRRTRIFALLVAANLAPPMLALASGAIVMRIWMRNPAVVSCAAAFSLVLTVMLLCSQVLLMALWTALCDPKHPWTRWVVSLLILAAAAALLWPCLRFWLKQDYFYYQDSMGVVNYYTLVVAVLFFILAFIGMLLVHVLVGILRMMRGYRIVMGETDVVTLPQFSLAAGMIWMGLVSALLGLSTSFSSADWFGYAAEAATIGTLLSALVVLPAAAMFFVGSSSRVKIAAFAALLVLLSVVEGMTFDWLVRAPGIISIPMLIGAAGAINALVTCVVLVNLRALKRMGARFVGLKRSDP